MDDRNQSQLQTVIWFFFLIILEGLTLPPFYSIYNAVVKSKVGKARRNKGKRMCVPDSIPVECFGRICVSP